MHFPILMIHRRAGFTLMELMLAISIAIIILFMALPSLRGLNAEKRLMESFEKFDNLARKAQLKAVEQQTAWTLIWDAGTITATPDEPLPTEAPAIETLGPGGILTPVSAPIPQDESESITVAEDEGYTLERPVILKPASQVPARWTFWRSGTCEPAIIRYQGPHGSWTAQYHPLTGHGEVIEQRLP